MSRVTKIHKMSVMLDDCLVDMQVLDSGEVIAEGTFVALAPSQIEAAKEFWKSASKLTKPIKVDRTNGIVLKPGDVIRYVRLHMPFYAQITADHQAQQVATHKQVSMWRENGGKIGLNEIESALRDSRIPVIHCVLQDGEWEPRKIIQPGKY